MVKLRTVLDSLGPPQRDVKGWQKVSLDRFKHLSAVYEGCLLYFGIREQKQILIIEKRFIVFQNVPH